MIGKHFWVVLLNTKHRYLMHTEVSVGTVKASLVGPREVFGPAVREGASSVLLCHNHPSASRIHRPRIASSRADSSSAESSWESRSWIHVIVGNGTGRWFSFRDVGEI